MTLIFVAALALLAATQGLPVQPPRDAKPAPPKTSGTGTIRGTVTDRTSGRPLARIVVRLSGRPLGAGSEMIALSDERGQYMFADLPPGRYSILFNPGEFSVSHLQQHFGTDRPFEAALRSGQSPAGIELASNETKIADIALWRTFAVEGRVLDESGDPMANIEVTVERWEAPGRDAKSRATDDRGAFRLFGLSPGEYRLCAEPRRGNPRAPRTDPDRPARTCFPSSLGDADAQPVSLATADVTGLEVRIRRSRLFSIAGMAFDSSGAPLAGGSVSLVRSEKRADAGGVTTAEVVPHAGGRFVINNVLPGEYAVRVEIGGPLNPQDKREREIGYAPILVVSDDIHGLSITTAKAAKIAGRIVFEDGAPALMDRRITIDAEPSSNLALGGAPVRTVVREDFTFELEGLFGPHVLHVWGLPSGWIVKAVKYRGRDATLEPVEFRNSSDPRDLEVSLTSRGAQVRGRVVLEDGVLPSQVSVVLLPASNPVTPKTIRSGLTTGAVVKADGAFELPLVRAGEYFLLAIPADVFPIGNRLAAPGYAERIATVAERVQLGENERRTVVLRVIKLP
jgi:hypothetical protein